LTSTVHHSADDVAVTGWTEKNSMIPVPPLTSKSRLAFITFNDGSVVFSLSSEHPTRTALNINKVNMEYIFFISVCFYRLLVIFVEFDVNVSGITTKSFVFSFCTP